MSAVVLVVGLLSCTPGEVRTTAVERGAAVEACGEGPACAKGQTCVEFFAIANEPSSPQHRCEQVCSYAGESCPEGRFCAMESRDVGFACRPVVEHTPPRGIAYLVELADVWALVKFGHPWLGGDAPEWDAALLDVIPRARQAESDAAFADVVARMLAALGDPRTRLLPPTETGDWPAPQPTRTQDGALVVTVAGLPTYDAAAMSELATSVRAAERVVFDLRGISGSMATYVDQAFDALGPALLARDARLPTARARVFHGYPPRVGTTSGGYYEAFETSAPQILRAGRTGNPPRVAFVLGPAQVLPAVAVPLLRDRRAFVVAPEPLDARAMAPSIDGPIAGGRIEMRSADVELDGKRPVIVADAIAKQDPIARAVALLRGTARSKGVRLEPVAERPVAPRPAVATELPDLAHRMLSAIHLWSVLDRFQAYPELRPRWRDALAHALAAMDDATTWALYIDALQRLAAATDDGHSYLAGPRVMERIGSAVAPFRPQFVEGALVVAEILAPELAGELAVGDVITAVDGLAVTERWDELAPLVAGSTPDAHRGSVARRMLRGQPDAPLRLLVFRGDTQREITASRWPTPAPPVPAKIYRTIANGTIGVVDLNHLTVDQVPAMFDAFARTDAIIFDLRGYPKGTAWSIAPYLDQHAGPTPAAEFRQPLVRSGLPWQQTTRFVQTIPEQPVERYRGRTVMLVDHRTISQAEHTGLFFAAANGTRFVGSPTAGANGDVTSHVLPDGLEVWFTGQAVVPIDRPPLQRVGLQPDVPVEPTLRGIRNGKDEVLQAAIDLLERSP